MSSALNSSHKLGIAGLVIVAILLVMYCQQKREQMTSAVRTAASAMPDMSVPLASSGGGSGLAPAQTDTIDYAPYPSASKPCATVQPFS